MKFRRVIFNLILLINDEGTLSDHKSILVLSVMGSIPVMLTSPCHDKVIPGTCFPHYWPFVRGGTNQLPVDSRPKRTIIWYLEGPLLSSWIRIWTSTWEPTQWRALTLITTCDVTLIAIPLDARLGTLQTNCQRESPEHHQIWIWLTECACSML